MAHKVARLLFFAALGVLGFCLESGSFRSGTAPVELSLLAGPTPDKVERRVYLAGDLAEPDLIAFTANAAASGQNVVLVDSRKHSKSLRAYLQAYQPEQLVAVGPFPKGPADLERRLGVQPAATLDWKRNPPALLWEKWFPHLEKAVVCPSEPRRQLLQAACLAGTLHAPLLVTGDARDEAALGAWLTECKAREVILVGAAEQVIHPRPGLHLVRLPDEDAVAALHRRLLHAQGPIQTLVVANPADSHQGYNRMAALAPWVALQHRAALLLTNDKGDNTAVLVRQAIQHPHLERAENLILVADLQAIPMEQRLNPVAGKDMFIEMEPLTPVGDEPFTFATGRLFHDSPAVVLLQLARSQLLSGDAVNAKREPRKALVASNAGGGLQFLEMFSRTTARELHNRGYQTTTMFGDDVSAEELRRQLPLHDIFLWEGHHNTLIKDYGFAEWTEPLPPSFVFLQSCLALTDVKTHHLLERGSVGVVGSSTRIFSATGGAFSLAYFDALLYDRQSLGGSLRQAKNFLLTYALLKGKRLGKEAQLTGANWRAAWAFTLWGDPTLSLPAPPPPAEALASVHSEVHGHSIVISLPDTAYDKVIAGNYEARMRPNARLAGLISTSDEGHKHMVPFIFTEVSLPKAPPYQTPRLTSKVPESHWAFSWDQRRRCGYLLVTPRSRDQRELRFHIEWEADAAGRKIGNDSPEQIGAGR